MPEANCDIRIPIPRATDTENNEENVIEFKEPVSPSGWPIHSVYVQAGCLSGEVNTWDYALNSSMEDINVELGVRFVNSTLTEWDLVEKEERLIHHLIMMIRATPAIFGRGRIADRLTFLENCLKDEDISSPGINVESLQSYFSFLDLKIRLKLPALTLTPNNNIYACWEDTGGNLFSVHFMEGQDVQFVIFKPNKRYPGRSIRISGTTTVDAIFEEARAHGMVGLISE